MSLILGNIIEVQAQELTLQETKELLYSHKWFLRRLEIDGKMYTVPKDIQGLKRVFINNGMSYSYLPSDNEADAEHHKWSITKTHITFYMYDEPQVYKYRLEDFIGYKLYLDLEGEDEMPTFVFEKAEKVDSKASEKGAIGQQIWTTENLNTNRFRNGDIIAEAKTAEEWQKAAKNGQPAWCYYENNTQYGKLYNWYAVNDPRGLAPKGWHIPSRKEVNTLVDFLGGSDKAEKKMKTTTLWITETGNNNSSGFSAMPGGYRNDEGDFRNANHVAKFWTTSLSSDKFRPAILFNLGTGAVKYYMTFYGDGCYVRCIKD